MNSPLTVAHKPDASDDRVLYPCMTKKEHLNPSSIYDYNNNCQGPFGNRGYFSGKNTHHSPCVSFSVMQPDHLAFKKLRRCLWKRCPRTSRSIPLNAKHPN